MLCSLEEFNKTYEDDAENDKFRYFIPFYEIISVQFSLMANLHEKGNRCTWKYPRKETHFLKLFHLFYLIIFLQIYLAVRRVSFFC